MGANRSSKATIFILFFTVLAVSSALDLSIISYDRVYNAIDEMEERFQIDPKKTLSLSSSTMLETGHTRLDWTGSVILATRSTGQNTWEPRLIPAEWWPDQVDVTLRAWLTICRNLLIGGKKVLLSESKTNQNAVGTVLYCFSSSIIQNSCMICLVGREKKIKKRDKNKLEIE